MICLKARELDNVDRMRNKLTFVLRFNYKHSALQQELVLLTSGDLIFKQSCFKFARKTVTLLVNQMMKNYYDTMRRPIRHIYIHVYCNDTCLIDTKIHRESKKYIMLPHMHEYDVYVDDAQDHICNALDAVWGFMHHFKKRDVTKKTRSTST